MLKGQKLDSSVRRGERFRSHILPPQEPRCAGRGCQERTACKRYQRAVLEAKVSNSVKGHVLMMNMSDADGICRSKR